MTEPLLVHIVDDDEPVRMSLSFALEAVGFEPATYVDADDFLARGRDKGGILISDVRMPGMNGIELTRVLRQGGSNMPIMLMTGHADRELQTDVISAGADAVLGKPVELALLLEEIERIVAARA